MIKNFPGAFLGIPIGGIVWLASGTLVAGAVVGIAFGIAWDIWRNKNSPDDSDERS
ncbi:hypothetical protein [Larsenimonas salina]|uniref:hypothetical protein n=1 Tax=Larsenimonas salina TaxID=1295565 RepID=UPI002072A4EC|nr:hypothetical protein [Larsenimonas salina]MCM5703856.1 hypothetical protein [Larsenimonas salina]